MKDFVTREEAGEIIDTTWHYSWHWPDGYSNWQEEAWKDCKSRIGNCLNTLGRLRGLEARLVEDIDAIKEK